MPNVTAMIHVHGVKRDGAIIELTVDDLLFDLENFPGAEELDDEALVDYLNGKVFQGEIDYHVKLNAKPAK